MFQDREKLAELQQKCEKFDDLTTEAEKLKWDLDIARHSSDKIAKEFEDLKEVYIPKFGKE